jgi:hypothetical protein
MRRIQRDELWPPLPFAEWKDTCATLHLWTQIVGKVRLTLSPWVNHSWHVVLYVTARGLTTSPIAHPDGQTFEIEFDFIAHRLLVRCSGGDLREIALRPMTVAQFYAELMSELSGVGCPVEISATPNELEDATPFATDTRHASYDPAAANRFWRALLQADRVFKEFRAEFIGKCSPVHFFWGSFDLAVTRFSGRTAPLHPGGVPHLPNAVAQEAYSHEVSSAGFWPGNEANPQACFYSYAYPAPEAFADAKIEPEAAFWSTALREWMLPYDAVRTADSPDATLRQFLESTYATAADLAKWDRAALERSGPPPVAFGHGRR